MDRQTELRHQAQRYFRLARGINDPKTVAELENLARELQREAAEIEAAGAGGMHAATSRRR